MRWNMEDPPSTSEAAIFSQPTYGMSFLTPLQVLNIEQISIINNSSLTQISPQVSYYKTSILIHGQLLFPNSVQLEYCLQTYICNCQSINDWHLPVLNCHSSQTIYCSSSPSSTNAWHHIFPSSIYLLVCVSTSFLAIPTPAFPLLSAILCTYLYHITTSHVLFSFYVKGNSVNTVLL